jgi:hypothetical protein
MLKGQLIRKLCENPIKYVSCFVTVRTSVFFLLFMFLFEASVAN